VSEERSLIAVTAMSKLFSRYATDAQLSFYATDSGWASIRMSVSSRPPRFFTDEEFKEFRRHCVTDPIVGPVRAVTIDEFDMMRMEAEIS